MPGISKGYEYCFGKEKGSTVISRPIFVLVHPTDIRVPELRVKTLEHRTTKMKGKGVLYGLRCRSKGNEQLCPSKIT